ncbi:hypothetical protein F3Y22_tig00111027pilonHSYRG00294 [Hibiscus syriacus]|uniref:Phytocyanin domain-containing protein n=1 Tax=Hibiscus syriacus TaxID=106335 RepID=A0A6A2Z6V2_HIBSY|nr:hypothetical protein F3Y22_tig00111027pilonHSYRG00294 [Hibiscus syriacus]
MFPVSHGGGSQSELPMEVGTQAPTLHLGPDPRLLPRTTTLAQRVTRSILTPVATRSSFVFTGTRYFICGTPGHCGQGMKVEVNTLASAGTPPGSAPGTPSSPEVPSAESPGSSLPPPPASSNGVGLKACLAAGWPHADDAFGHLGPISHMRFFSL